MRKAWWFAGFAAGVAMIIAAVSWVTVTARALESAAAADRRQAFREESARLALWRMDSLLTPLIAREAARPYGAYSAFAPAERAYNRLFAPVKRGDVVLPSPLLGLEQPEVLLHFQISPRGALTSPQVPLGNQRALAEQGFVDHASILRAEARLAQLGALVDRPRLTGALDHLAGGLAEATRERSLAMCMIVDNNMNTHKDGPAATTPGPGASAQASAVLDGVPPPTTPAPTPVTATAPLAARAPPARGGEEAARQAAEKSTDDAKDLAPTAGRRQSERLAPAPIQLPAPTTTKRKDDPVGGKTAGVPVPQVAPRGPAALSSDAERATAKQDQQQLEQAYGKQELSAQEANPAAPASTTRSEKEQQARIKNYYNAAGNDIPEGKADQDAQTANDLLQLRIASPAPVTGAPTAPGPVPAASHVTNAPPAPTSPPLLPVAAPPPSETTILRAEIMRPLWLGDTLLLARRVTVDGTEHIQGCWLDWPRIRAQLLDGVKDLLPDAQLVADANEGDDWRHRLATLPVRLDPGEGLPDYHDSPRAALTLTLVVAWLCVGLATVAGATLLLGALDLSERRGAFVSAVTHELRTPLTTFRLYADLLGGGMVPGEAERQRCLDTLRSEADRLAHLVENVLAYARLERAQLVPAEPVAVSDLLHTACERLAERARQAGLELVAEHEDAALDSAVRADPAAVERILFNLVDNAAKYAAPAATDRRLHLAVRVQAGGIAFSVRDHGPGLPGDIARRLFVPFAKSAHEAARSAPGVGLGLALSRRLARQLGGRLEVVPGADGACFALWLPVA